MEPETTMLCTDGLMEMFSWFDFSKKGASGEIEKLHLQVG